MIIIRLTYAEMYAYQGVEEQLALDKAQPSLAKDLGRDHVHRFQDAPREPMSKGSFIFYQSRSIFKID